MNNFLGSIMNSAFDGVSDFIKDKLGGGLGDFLLSESGIQMIVDQAKKAGLEEKVKSWIGDGENLPISTDEIRSLLTDEQVQGFVSKTGLPAATLLPALATLLPGAMNHVSKNANGTDSPTRSATEGDA